MVAVNQQAAAAAAAAAQQAAAAAALKQNVPRANYKYAPGVRNPAQAMAMGGPHFSWVTLTEMSRRCCYIQT